MASAILAAAADGALHPSGIGFDPLDVAFWIGLVSPVIVSLALQFGWSHKTKFWVSVGITVVLAGFAWWTTSYPAQWELIATQFAVIFTSSQVVFYALKPSGILEWLEYKTTPAVGVSEEGDTEPTIFPSRQSLKDK